jgi:predicted regulator of Ras-like GTPase activity (Roadblock/LC7/MglB family)
MIVNLATKYGTRTTTIPADVDANRVAWVARSALRNAERRLRMIGGDVLIATTLDGSRVDLQVTQ